MSDKLPEWPERPNYVTYGEESLRFILAERVAALARMEALVDYAQHLHTCRGPKCICGLDELLAACEREKS